MEEQASHTHPIQYGCAEVVKLFAPVLICMALVIANINFIGWFSVKDAYIIYTPFHEDSAEPVTLLWHAFANTFIFLTVIIAMTFLIVFLYKFGHIKVIIGMLVLSTVMLLLFVVWLYLAELFKALNWPLDYATACFLVWNNAITGILTILWKGPLKLQQAYLIFNCSLMALAFIKFLPEWTAWVLLLMISVWDLVAVLCPKGPLRMLVETAHSRGEDLTKLPALLYTSIAHPIYSTLRRSSQINKKLNVTYSEIGEECLELNEKNNLVNDDDDLSKRSDVTINEASKYQEMMDKKKAMDEKKEKQSEKEGNYDTLEETSNNTNADDLSRKSLPPASENGKKEEKISDGKERKGGKETRVSEMDNSSTRDSTDSPNIRGAKLGLGDFVFYSILIGKAAKTNDWTVILACVSAILVGLGMTLVLLIIFKKALPALPISICLGLVMYFGFYYITSPFLVILSEGNIFL